MSMHVRKLQIFRRTVQILVVAFIVTIPAVARYNNWMGRLYFIPVRFGHQIVLSDTMRRVEAQLSASESDGEGY